MNLYFTGCRRVMIFIQHKYVYAKDEFQKYARKCTRKIALENKRDTKDRHFPAYF